MNYDQVMSELESLGTAQNCKIYARHGVSGPMFGVSYANLTKLKKKLKTAHDLAQKLWNSGNHDARVLATMVADGEQMKSRDLDAWARQLDDSVLTDAFIGLALRTPWAQKKMERWTQSKQEWLGRSGWGLLCRLAMSEEAGADVSYEDYLDQIENRVHRSRNRVRESMNSALIAIGLRNTRLERRAVAAARRIGKIEVDHGQTACKTRDAVEYITKARARKKQSKRKVRARTR